MICCTKVRLAEPHEDGTLNIEVLETSVVQDDHWHPLDELFAAQFDPPVGWEGFIIGGPVTVTVDASEEIPATVIAGPFASASHVLVTDWNGAEVYNGPTPIPQELITVTPEMALTGHVFSFDFTPANGLRWPCGHEFKSHEDYPPAQIHADCPACANRGPGDPVVVKE